MSEREPEPDCSVWKEEERALTIAYEDDNPNRLYEDEFRDLNYFPTIEQLGHLNIRLYTNDTPHCTSARDYLFSYKIPYTEIKIEEPSNRVEIYNNSAVPKSDYYFADDVVLHAQTNQRVYPYIYIGDKFVGGYHLFSKYVHLITIRVFENENNRELLLTRRLLDKCELPYKRIPLEIVDDQQYRQKLIRRTGRTDGPYIFVGFDYLWNGYEDLKEFVKKRKPSVTKKLWKRMENYFFSEDKTRVEL